MSKYPQCEVTMSCGRSGLTFEDETRIRAHNIEVGTEYQRQIDSGERQPYTHRDIRPGGRIGKGAK